MAVLAEHTDGRKVFFNSDREGGEVTPRRPAAGEGEAGHDDPMRGEPREVH